MSLLQALLPWDNKRDLLQFSDNINSRHTVIILAALAIATAFPHLIFDEPIVCSHPDGFTQEDYNFANKVISLGYC